MNNKYTISRFSFILLFSCVFLMAINISGLFLSLRPENIKEMGIFKNDVTLTYDEAIHELNINEKTENLEFIYFLNNLVNQTMAHEWRVYNEDDYINNRYTIPVWENWLLYGLSYVKPDIYKKYFMVDPYKALERGVGWCSQHAEVLKNLLNNKNVEAELLGLGGHTVVGGKIGSAEFVADPDYGIVLPFNLKTLEKNLDTVTYYYRNIGENYKLGVIDYSVKDLMRIYGEENNTYASVQTVSVGEKYRILEKALYILKWLIPVVLLFIVYIKEK